MSLKHSFKTVLLLLVTLLIVISAAQAAQDVKIALESKFDGQTVQLRWMVSDKSLNYRYKLWRSPADNLQQRSLVAETAMLPFAQAKDRLKNDPAALKLMYPFETAANRQELNASLAQADNRLGMLLFVSTQSKEVAAAMGQYYADGQRPAAGKLIYTIEAYAAEQLVASAASPVNLDKIDKLSIVWNLQAHLFDWGVALKWDGYENFTTFNIYRRKLGESDFMRINKAPVQVESSINADGTLSIAPYFFTDTDISDQQIFHYQVRGVDIFGDEGPASVNVAGMKKTDPHPAPLPRPSIVAGETSITVSWLAAPDKKVTSYNIYRSRRYDGGFEKLNQQPLTTLSYTDASVQLDLSYFYYVTAINTGGFESLPSLAVQGFAKDATPPAAVSQLLSQLEAAKVVLAWQPVADEDLLGYRVYRTMHEQDIDWALLNQEPLTSPQFTDVLSANLSRYPFFYRVTALDWHYNESAPSAPVKVQLPDVTAPKTPEFTSYQVSDQQVALNWSAVTVYDLAGYHIYRKSGASEVKITATPLQIPSYTDVSPPVAEALEYRVTAIDLSANESQPSNPLQVLVSDTQPPAIDTFSATVSGAEVLLQLTTSATDSAGFDIYRSRNGRDFVKLNSSRQKSQIYTDQVLKGKRYFYRAVLWDHAGNGTESDIREVMLPK